MRSLARAAALVVSGLFVAAPRASAQTLYIEADRVVVAPGRSLGPATIEVRDGRIVAVREGAPGAARGGRVLRAAVVIPGLIDARTTAGLSGLIQADDDTDDRGGPIRSELRAEDGFDLQDPLLLTALRSGVTVVQAGPGDANSIGGQAGIFRTYASTVAEATLRSPSAVVLSLTEDAKTTYAARNRLPTTRMANVGLIRQALLDAGHHARASNPTANAGHEALARVLSRELPAIIAAERLDEIVTALRLAREHELRIMPSGAAESAEVTAALLDAGVTVLLGPVDTERSATGVSDAGTAAALHAAGVPFALVTGDARAGTSLLGWARETVRHGLAEDAALAAITTVPAAILGIDAGTIETGRTADLVLLDGAPFETRTRVQAVIAGGHVAWQAAGDRASVGANVR
jgi:imidazolonepropionase-like amidohydrolase